MAIIKLWCRKRLIKVGMVVDDLDVLKNRVLEDKRYFNQYILDNPSGKKEDPLITFVLEKDGTEITNNEYFSTISQNTKIIVLFNDESWIPGKQVPLNPQYSTDLNSLSGIRTGIFDATDHEKEGSLCPNIVYLDKPSDSKKQYTDSHPPTHTTLEINSPNVVYLDQFSGSKKQKYTDSQLPTYTTLEIKQPNIGRSDIDSSFITNCTDSQHSSPHETLGSK